MHDEKENFKWHKQVLTVCSHFFPQNEHYVSKEHLGNNLVCSACEKYSIAFYNVGQGRIQGDDWGDRPP